MLIVLAGTIGAGKSSLAAALGEHLGTEVFYEAVDNNPVLDLYYQDPKKYAFLLQIFFLNKPTRQTIIFLTAQSLKMSSS